MKSNEEGVKLREGETMCCKDEWRGRESAAKSEIEERNGSLQMRFKERWETLEFYIILIIDVKKTNSKVLYNTYIL